MRNNRQRRLANKKKEAENLQILAVANQKGGCGKSTTAAALAQAATARGLRVLAVDLDPQANLSFFTGANANLPGAFDLLENGRPAAVLIQHTECGLDVIPAALELQTASTGKGSARRLRAALAPIRGQYDLIVIDTSTAPGEARLNALMAATQMVIPLGADIGGLQGLFQIYDEARQVQQANPALQICGCIITKYDNRSTLIRTMADRIRSAADEMGLPFLGQIRQAIAIQEAQSFQISLYEHAPKSYPAQDYMQVLDKITNNQ